MGFSLDYFGNTYNSFYINNNGNISFGSPVNAYTPLTFNTESLAPMIAPYWADVDTTGTGTVAVRTDIPNQVIVTWDNVGYYSQHRDKTASFQLVLRGPDYPIPANEGNVGFFYKDVQWETGDASGGIGGFGGTQAAVGFSDGLPNVNPGELLLPGSQQSGVSQLVNNRYFWFNLPTDAPPCNASSGGCSPPPPPPPCNASSGGGGCNNRSLIRRAAIASDYTSQSVPESTSALGLLALLSWGIIKAMKIRLEK